MALSGLEIFKQLPKTNCGDCGIPTCLAFAMKLAAGQAELASCPHVSEEAKAALSEASAPPMRAVTVGVGDGAFTVGEETVLFRHEKTFVNSAAIGVAVDASADDAEIDAVVAHAVAANFERVQQILRCGFIAVRGSGDPARFAAVIDAHPGGHRPAARADEPGSCRDDRRTRGRQLQAPAHPRRDRGQRRRDDRTREEVRVPARGAWRPAWRPSPR